MSELKRKKNESFEAFMRRVKDTWKKSGKLLQARKVQYFEPKGSKNMRRKETVCKTRMASKKAYLQKIGKLPEKENTY